MSNKLDTWAKRGRELIGTATLFGALLYFVGRRYLESYFATIGIPSDFLEFNVADYIYQGAHPIRLLIVVAFTSIGIGLFRFITYDYPEEMQPSVDTKRLDASEGFRKRVQNLRLFMDKVMLVYTILLFIIFAFILPILALIEIFGYRFNPALNLTIILYLSFTVYWGIAIMFDQKILPRLKRYKRISKFFFWGGVITFFLLPYLGAGSYGIFMGMADKLQSRLVNEFQTITLSAQEPLNEAITWKKTDNSLYETTDNLYAIYSNERFLFIISDKNVNEVIMISKDNLSSFTIDAHSLTLSPSSPSP